MTDYWRQPPPFCVKVELSEGCNLYCTFCGLRSIREQREKHYKFMTVETAERIAHGMAQLGWRSRIEFAMHGEPTMNPARAEIVGVFRRHLPKASVMMTSNGGGLLSGGVVDNLEALFDAGLNVLALDDYEGANIVPKIRERVSNHVGESEQMVLPSGRTVAVREYPRQTDGNPHKRKKPGEHLLSYIRDIERETTGTHAKVHNTAGLSAPRDPAWNHRKCARPFRELSFRHDGRVAICCIDWRGTYKIGSIEDGLDALWQSPLFGAARTFLGTGDRGAIPTCDGCSSYSQREHLLPDASARMRIPPPTERDAALVAQAEAGPPLATMIRRDWE
jgi:hypothetical protein